MCSFYTYSHAQRLNSKGLKMVSEIERGCYTGERFLGTVRYVFDYDNQNNLVSMRIFDTQNKLWVEYKKIGNKIIKKSYDELEKYHTDTILLDDSGKLTYYKITLSNDCKSFEAIYEYHFNYNYDKEKSEFYIYDINVLYTYIEDNGDYVSKRDLPVVKVSYVDTNPDKTFDSGIKHIDYKIINDMNVNVLPFFGFGFNYSFLNNILKTEWGNTRSDRFPQYNEDVKTFRYAYIYDDNDNLINIKMINTSLGLIKNEISIKYIE